MVMLVGGFGILTLQLRERRIFGKMQIFLKLTIQ